MLKDEAGVMEGASVVAQRSLAEKPAEEKVGEEETEEGEELY